MRFLRRHREAADHHRAEDWQPRLYGRIITVALLIAYVVAFIFENTKHVAVHFVFFTTHTSIVWLILLNVVLGAVGGILLAQLERRRRRRRAA